MTLENKLGITDQVELARKEERLSKMRARELFEKGILNELTAGSIESLFEIHRYLFQDVYPFAGKIRTVNISKAALCLALNIPTPAADAANVARVSVAHLFECADCLLTARSAHAVYEQWCALVGHLARDGVDLL